MSIKFVKNEADFNNYLKNNKYLVANFTASWCGPCQALKPIVDALYKDPKYSKIEIVRVDLDANQRIAAQYSISSVPTFVFFESSKETERVTGFLPPKIEALLSKYAVLASADASIPSRGLAKPSAIASEVSAFIPKGYDVLNDVIHFGDMVMLNTVSLVKSDKADSRNVFRTAKKGSTTVLTDADSQALFFVPLNNICKLYSVLIKFAKPEPAENLELDEDELENETQKPSVLKLWPNRPGVLLFDDTAGDAPHVEHIGESDSQWYEAKVKFVRFQNVQNLNIFIDGADDDSHTLVERIVLVGVSGDSTDQGSLQAAEE